MALSFWNKISNVSPVKYIALLSVLAIAFAIFINGFFGFDGIDFNGDSFVYFRMAKYFKQSISSLTIPAREHWPYGYPAMLSIPFFLIGETFKAAQYINLIAGGCLMALIGYMILFIARLKNLDEQKMIVFVCSALILLFGRGTMLKYQILVMSDMMGAFWALLMMFIVWKWKCSKYPSLLAFSGVALGLAFSTRFVYILMLIPFAIILFDEFSLKKIFFYSFIFGLGFSIAVLPEVIVVLKGTTPSSGYDLLNEWSIKNLFTLTFESIDGHQTSHLPSVLYYLILPFRWEDFTPILLPVVCMGIFYAVYELPRWLWLSLIVWYLTFYILLCGIPIQNPRIAFSLYQPITIFAAMGVLWCLQRWQTKLVMSALFVLTIVSIPFSIKYIKKLVVEKTELKETAKQVADITAKDSRIISTSLYAVYLAYPMDVEAMSIYAMSIEEAETILSDRKKTFLVIDDEKFIPQWSNYPAGKTYWWIRNHYNCNRIKKVGNYTIYEINSGSDEKTLTASLVPNTKLSIFYFESSQIHKSK